MALISYFRQSKEELRKVVWPTRRETLNGTLMVIVMSVVVAAFLGAADYLLNFVFEQVLKRF